MLFIDYLTAKTYTEREWQSCWDRGRRHINMNLHKKLCRHGGLLNSELFKNASIILLPLKFLSPSFPLAPSGEGKKEKRKHRPSTEWNWFWSVLIFGTHNVLPGLLWISYRDSRRLRGGRKKKKRGGGGRLKTAGFLQPACLSSPSSPEGETFWQLPQDIIFTWRGQLLESPLAPRRAVSLSRLFFSRSSSKNLKPTEPNQELIKHRVSTAAAKLRTAETDAFRRHGSAWWGHALDELCTKHRDRNNFFFYFGMKHSMN